MTMSLFYSQSRGFLFLALSGNGPLRYSVYIKTKTTIS